MQYYTKTVVGCKENRRYEMGVKKIVIFLDTHQVLTFFLATSHCFAIIIYLI